MKKIILHLLLYCALLSHSQTKQNKEVLQVNRSEVNVAEKMTELLKPIASCTVVSYEMTSTINQLPMVCSAEGDKLSAEAKHIIKNSDGKIYIDVKVDCDGKGKKKRSYTIKVAA